METKKIDLKEFKYLVKTIIEEEMLQEELNEISLGGLRSVGTMLGDKFSKATSRAGDVIKKGAQDVKQAYQTGEKKAKFDKAQKELATLVQKMTQIIKSSKEQIEQLQQQYSALTGGQRYNLGGRGKPSIHKPVMKEGRIQWMTESEIRNVGTDYSDKLNKISSLDSSQSSIRNQEHFQKAFEGWYKSFKNLKLTPQQIIDGVRKGILNMNLDK